MVPSKWRRLALPRFFRAKQAKISILTLERVLIKFTAASRRQFTSMAHLLG